ncbi:hypothetical protein HDU87_004507 [Geranomyces variabilis]|uniref:Uncharacterized protein n=1 Tax=Geranomyces variabilis TaxID=109894 RepID=A0AAD5XQI7_9FUNG|nr:hypothetical protein HDU87_004507 [Geranomyces variabilis]
MSTKPDDSDAVYANLVDAHCHPTDHPSTLGCIPKLRTSRLLVMGTRSEDWEAVEQLATDHPAKVVPAFGIHPWFAASATDASLATLKALLARHPAALVGEIGIDGVARDRATMEVYPLAPQLEIFKKQLLLAAETSRRVSVHTVRAHGHLLAALQDHLRDDDKTEQNGDAGDKTQGRERSIAFPPAVMNHSWSGSVETMRAMLAMKPGGDRLWFSFSTGVNGRSPKTPERIRAVPDNRVLIESDLHDAELIDAALWDACRMVADAKGWSMLETAERTRRNAKEFLGETC